ncbi:MAG: DnaJ domain-containing protein [Deltaproteobacteria bacterium]|nr:DnaJ domain-containing protein [Deltaproteobacteria bacterium]
MQKDYYALLSVEKTATQQQIKAAYRKLAFQYHPDRNKDNPATAARMKEVNESYAVLSDPDKRREYDTLRQQFGSSAYSQFRQNYTEQDIFRGSDIQQIFEELSRAFGFRGFEDVFREAYGRGYQTFQFQRPGAFAKGFAFRAGPGTSGSFLGGGLGKVIQYALKKKWGIELPERGKDLEDIITLSPDLMQQGGAIAYDCRKTGKTLQVKIPPGLRNGQKIRLKGMGEPGKGGGEPGDLYVRVHPRNPLWQKILDWSKQLKALLGKSQKP